MKKFLTGFVILFVFAVTLPLTANAQTCYPRKRSNVNRSNYNNAYYAPNRNYRNRTYYSQNNNRRPGYFQRHRNVKNIALGAGGGAIIGALIGGRKGLAVGALAGAGSGALYTYVLKPKKRTYRYYR